MKKFYAIMATALIGVSSVFAAEVPMTGAPLKAKDSQVQREYRPINPVKLSDAKFVVNENTARVAKAAARSPKRVVTPSTVSGDFIFFYQDPFPGLADVEFNTITDPIHLVMEEDGTVVLEDFMQWNQDLWNPATVTVSEPVKGHYADGVITIPTAEQVIGTYKGKNLYVGLLAEDGESILDAITFEFDEEDGVFFGDDGYPAILIDADGEYDLFTAFASPMLVPANGVYNCTSRYKGYEEYEIPVYYAFSDMDEDGEDDTFSVSGVLAKYFGLGSTFLTHFPIETLGDGTPMAILDATTWERDEDTENLLPNYEGAAGVIYDGAGYSAINYVVLQQSGFFYPAMFAGVDDPKLVSFPGHVTFSNEDGTTDPVVGWGALILPDYSGWTGFGMGQITYVDPESGVESINVDNQNGPAVYYNLQGVRVNNPVNGLYIKKEGNKATKVLVK